MVMTHYCVKRLSGTKSTRLFYKTNNIIFDFQSLHATFLQNRETLFFVTMMFTWRRNSKNLSYILLLAPRNKRSCKLFFLSHHFNLKSHPRIEFVQGGFFFLSLPDCQCNRGPQTQIYTIIFYRQNKMKDVLHQLLHLRIISIKYFKPNHMHQRIKYLIDPELMYAHAYISLIWQNAPC